MTDTAHDDGQQQTDKETNLERLRQSNEAKDAEIAELRKFRDEAIVRKSGFDPGDGRGKSLLRDLGAGLVEATIEDTASLLEWAESEYQWKPAENLNVTEQQQTAATNLRTDLSQSSGSDDPPDQEAAAIQAIQAARDAGDWAEAARLERELAKLQGG